MKISFNQRWQKTADNNGFGYARQMCEKSLRELGHTVNFADSTADIEINFIQPQHWVWSGVNYRIAYLPWESTSLKPGWLKKLNSQVDEVWTPSPVIAEWFRDAGIIKPVHVYEHGVDKIWTPKQRFLDGPMQVFHHGAEARRKGFVETMNVFKDVLQPTGAMMNFKATLNGFNVPIPDVNIIRERLSTDDLVALYHEQHLMVYPSWGEGFGLTPLQAMATGMPVIITKGWAPYEHLLPDYAVVDTTLVDSPWQDIHPGKMLKPDYRDLKEKVRANLENFEFISAHAALNVPRVTEEYDWLAKTEKAFEHLK